MVSDARDHDLAAEACMLGQRRRDHHAALLVRFGLGRARVEVPLHQASLLAEWVEPGETRLDGGFPLVAWKHVEAAAHAEGDDGPAGKRLAKLRRDGVAA